ncbi:MAG: acyl carrier protein [Deltaproteobacteria bacterium]|nr:acyl carrier protein [Deltaproteobacteria bacterium]
MSERDRAPAQDLAAEVRGLILARAPRSWKEHELDYELPLMKEGLGLDSVAVVEILVACEDRFGVRVEPEAIAVEVPTVGLLIQRVEERLAARPADDGSI